MRKLSKLLLGATLPLLLNGCAIQPPQGPGMTVHFGNGVPDTALIFEDARTSTGQRFPNPGSLAPDDDPYHGGKVMGAMPDGRILPEWVAFTWFKTEYPDSIAKTKAEIDALPLVTEKVAVRDRIPQDVIDNIVRSNKLRGSANAPDLGLWVYFVWFDTGIKLSWTVKDGCCTVVSSGGEPIFRK